MHMSIDPKLKLSNWSSVYSKLEIKMRKGCWAVISAVGLIAVAASSRKKPSANEDDLKVQWSL